MRRRILALLLLTATACSPAQRTAAGVGLGLVGAGVTYGAIEWMTPSCGAQPEPGQGCVQHPEPLPPQVGFPVVFAGIGVVVVGGMLVATAGDRLSSASETPAPPLEPEEVAFLEEKEAVAMAVAEYLVVGLHRNAKPATLLDIDDTQVTLRATERHAELSNLRIRAGADETWRVVGACYAYEHEWRVTSVGSTLACPR